MMNACLRSHLVARAALLPALLLAFGPFASAADLSDAETIRVPKDQPTIQAALHAAGYGDVVLVSSGTYAEALDWFERTNVTLRAKGKVTIVLPDDGGEAQEVPLLMRARHLRDVRIEGFRFEGNGQGVGLDVDHVRGLVLRDCEFRSLSTGLRARSCEGLLVRKNRFQDLLDGLDLRDVDRSVVEDNEIKGVVNRGLGIRSASELTIRDNGVRGGQSGVLVESSHAVTVADNDVRAAELGIFADGTAIEVIDNVVQGCHDGVQVGAGVGTSVAARRNRIVKCAEDGLIVRGTSNVVEDNTIKKCGAAGIRVVVGDTLASGNTVSACGSFGIYVGESITTLAGNRIRHSSEADVYSVYPSSTTMLENDYKTSASGF